MNLKILKLAIIVLIVSIFGNSETLAQNSNSKGNLDFYTYPTPSDLCRVIFNEKL
jgi:hypothetical protein